MNNTDSQLNSCAQSLREIRAQLPGNLDPGVMARLDSVIERLEQAAEEEEGMCRAPLEEGLAVVARIVELTLAVSQLLSQFRG